MGSAHLSHISLYSSAKKTAQGLVFRRIVVVHRDGHVMWSVGFDIRKYSIVEGEQHGIEQ